MIFIASSLHLPGMMRKAKAYLDLTRIVPNQIMIGVGVVVGEVVSYAGPPPLRQALLGFAGPFILGMSTFAMNDYYDREADLKGARLDRPIVRGDLSPQAARWVFMAGFPIGLLLSSAINFGCLVIAVAFSGLALAYNLRLKDTGLPGNLFIASTMAIPFVYGSVAAGGRLPVAILVLSSIAFLAGVGREVLKGIMDYEGDAVRDTKTLARTRGIKCAARVSALCILAAVSLSPIPFLSKASGSFHYNLSYIGPVVLTDLLLGYVTVRVLGLSRPNEAARLRQLSLVALTVGLLGFLLGSV